VAASVLWKKRERRNDVTENQEGKEKGELSELGEGKSGASDIMSWGNFCDKGTIKRIEEN